jgi:hypothetical protein
LNVSIEPSSNPADIYIETLDVKENDVVEKNDAVGDTREIIKVIFTILFIL